MSDRFGRRHRPIFNSRRALSVLEVARQVSKATRGPYFVQVVARCMHSVAHCRWTLNEVARKGRAAGVAPWVSARPPCVESWACIGRLCSKLACFPDRCKTDYS